MSDGRAREHRDEWVSYCPHLLEDGSECECAPGLVDVVEEVERLRSALTLAQKLVDIPAEQILDDTERVRRIKLVVDTALSLDAPSDPCVTPVSGYAREAGT